MSEQKQPAEVGPVELVLGPLPETDVLAIGSLDMREDVEGYSAEAMEIERQRCYALGVAAERERLAAACWERRGHFASDWAARAFAELVRDGRA